MKKFQHTSFPCFFIPNLLKILGRTVPCQAEAIDSNGVLPMRAESRLFTTAYSFRRHCQKVLPMWLQQSPSPNPTQDTKLPHLKALDENLTSKWPSAELLLVGAKGNWMQSVSTNLQTPVTKITGGRQAAVGSERMVGKQKGASAWRDKPEGNFFTW